MNLDKHLTRLRDWLSKPWLVTLLLALSVLRTLPSVGNGLFLDDHIHRAMIQQDTDLPWHQTAPWGLYDIFPDDDALRATMFDKGVLPWWASEDFQLSFWRPLSSLTHALDYSAWPTNAVVMHLHSTLWFLALLAVALAVYRRFLTPLWLSSLAAVLYAFDDLHALPVGWLANRNAIITALFGLLALWAHDRWRRDDWTAGAFLGPVMLALGLASGELAVGVVAYLVSYAACLDEGSVKSRVASVLPYVAVALAWQITYRWLDHGAAGSVLYFDPVGDPLGFIAVLIKRTPVLFLGLFGVPSSELHTFLAPSLRLAHSILGGVWMAVMAGVLWPLLKHDRTARFWALAMILAILPACTGILHDRMLVLVGFGGMGLMAQLIGMFIEPPPWRPESRRWQTPALAFVAASIALHLIAAPLTMPFKAAGVGFFADLTHGPSVAFEAPPEMGDKTLIIANAQPGFLETYFALARASAGEPNPARLRCLSISNQAVTLLREDAHTLVVTADCDSMCAYAVGMMRPEDQPLHTGHITALSDATYEVLEGLEGPRLKVRVRFDKPLDHPSHIWIAGREHGFEPFVLPRVGQSTIEPAVEASPLW